MKGVNESSQSVPFSTGYDGPDDGLPLQSEHDGILHL